MLEHHCAEEQTKLADGERHLATKPLVERMCQPWEKGYISNPKVKSPSMPNVVYALTAPNDGTSHVRGAIGKAQEPGIPRGRPPYSELVLVEGLGAIDNGLICSNVRYPLHLAYASR
jgi:hypothetical protein